MYGGRTCANYATDDERCRDATSILWRIALPVQNLLQQRQ